jgi:mono/diheme cytochrome c family protein
MRMLTVVGILSLLLAVSCSSSNQQPSASTPTPVSSAQVSVQITPVPSGAQLYTVYCASCHGEDGKGHGPAAPALKAKLPDLTTLAKRKAGKFPEGDVFQVIKWGGGIVGHGSKEMPVWGEAFKPSDPKDEPEVDRRVRALTDYLKSIQSK